MKVKTLVAVLFFVSSTINGQNFHVPNEIPEEMKRLSFLVGEYNGDTKFYDKDGNVTRIMKGDTFGANFIRSHALGGYIIESTPDSNMARNWVFYDEIEHVYYDVNVDYHGNFHVFKGGFEGDRFVISDLFNRPSRFGARKGKPIRWRRSYYNITPNSHDVSFEYSHDEGKNWVLSNIQEFKRIGENSLTNNKSTEDLSFLIGDWKFDANDPYVKKYPDLAEKIIYRYSYTNPDKKVVKWIEAFNENDENTRGTEGIITFNPTTKQNEFIAYEKHGELVFNGAFKVNGRKSFTKTYTIFYGNKKFPMEGSVNDGRALVRETCDLIDSNTVKCKTEYQSDGIWKTFGPSEFWTLKKVK